MSTLITVISLGVLRLVMFAVLGITAWMYLATGHRHPMKVQRSVGMLFIASGLFAALVLRRILSTVMGDDWWWIFLMREPDLIGEMASGISSLIATFGAVGLVRYLRGAPTRTDTETASYLSRGWPHMWSKKTAEQDLRDKQRMVSVGSHGSCGPASKTAMILLGVRSSR